MPNEFATTDDSRIGGLEPAAVGPLCFSSSFLKHAHAYWMDALSCRREASCAAGISAEKIIHDNSAKKAACVHVYGVHRCAVNMWASSLQKLSAYLLFRAAAWLLAGCAAADEGMQN